MKLVRGHRLLCSCLVAIVLTGCMGTSNEEISQRRFDAISTVTKTFYVILDLEPPETLAATTPCFDSFGNETSETGARFGGVDLDLGRRAEKSLIDEILAGFGEPPQRADREGQLNTGQDARIVDFTVTIDDFDVFVTSYVSDAGQFGWSAHIGC